MKTYHSICSNITNTMFRVVFWDILLCKIILNGSISFLGRQSFYTAVYLVDNHFTRQYIPEDNSEHHTRRRENVKSLITNTSTLRMVIIKLSRNYYMNN
jgi:hypothetical protein